MVNISNKLSQSKALSLMKIMYAIKNFYPAQSGGPANSVYYLSKSLVNKNFEVFVIATDNDLNTKKIKRNQFLKF